MSRSPAAILFDEAGNKVGVLLDDTIYRLQVEADLAPGATVNIGAVAAENPNLIFAGSVQNGGSPDLVVDGTTPVIFSVLADPTDDIIISELRFVVTVDSIDFDGGSFGDEGNPLANGILVKLTVNDGSTSTIATIKINEDFLKLASTTGLNVLLAQSGLKDVMAASFIFGGRMLLKAGTGDKVEVVIQDDLTNAPKKLKYFQAVLYGTKVTP